MFKGRQETVERSFADAKQHHGHRYTDYRGLAKVQMQGLLAAACQNMKKIALVQSRKGSKGPNPPNSSADGLFGAIARSLMPFSWRRWPIGRLVSQ
ncbi:MAG: transposase [Aeromonas sp.]